MDKKSPWYFAQRAEHLATVVLTRDPRVRIVRSEADHGIDILAYLKDGAMFGVEAKGSLGTSAFLTKDLVVRSPLARDLLRGARSCAFPLALMVFDMSDDTGYLGWILQPRLESQHAGLAIPNAIQVEVIASKTISDVVDHLGRWHKAHLRQLGR